MGGVSANGALRTMLREALPTMRIRFPEPAIFCTDNAAMIAAAAAFLIEEAGMEEACAAFETVASLPLEDALQKDKEKKETKKT